jgi:hypothetical protein
MNEYIKLLENYFNLTHRKYDSTYVEEIDVIATQIIAIQDEQVEIVRVLKYRGNALEIRKQLERRVVKDVRILPLYTISEDFEE